MQSALAQKILIIEQQFAQAGAGHVGQFYFGFFGSGGGQTPLGDVLHAAPGHLHHLVMGAGTLVDKAVAEDDRTVIGKLGRLKTAQLAKTAILRDKTCCHIRNTPRS